MLDRTVFGYETMVILKTMQTRHLSKEFREWILILASILKVKGRYVLCEFWVVLGSQI